MPYEVTPYSETTDMLVNDVTSNLDKQKFIEDAAKEIDSKLGWIYTLPLTPLGDETEFPAHEVLLLQQISNRLASGRWLLAAFASAEDSSIHAYGQSLINLALADLMAIANGQVDLSATRITDSNLSNDYALPAVINYDEESLLLGVENTVLRGEPWYTRPGAITWP